MTRFSFFALLGTTLLPAILLPTRSGAQHAGDTARVAPLIVTATRSPLEVTRTPASVTVVTGDELRAQGITHLTDALRTVPGLTVVQSGSIGAPSQLFVRGGQSNYTKVLIDGVPANEPGGAFDFGLLTLDDVERIEVVRGPASVVWGSDAVSAVVHVITRQGAADRASLTARGGTFGTADLTGVAEGGRGRFRGAVTAAHHTSRGSYDINNGYRNSLLGGSATFTAPTGATIRANGRYASVTAHFPTDFTGAPVDPNAHRIEERATASAELRHPFGAATAIVTAGQSLVHASSLDPANEEPGTSSSFDTRSLRRQLEARTEVPVTHELLLTAGAVLERQDRASASTYVTNFSGLPSETDRQENAGRRTNRGAYAELLARGSATTLTLGARLDHSGTYGDFATYRVALAHDLPTDTRLRASVGTAFREPSFDEVLPSAFSTGNPDIDPERSASWEVGAEQAFAGRRVVVGATWFHQRFEDMIDYFADTYPGRYENVAAAVARGAELEARVSPARHWTVDGSLTLVRTRVATEGFGGALSDGRPLLRRPERSATAGITRTGDRLSVAARLAHVGQRPDVRFFHAAPWSAEAMLPAYTKVDLSAEVPVLRRATRFLALTLRVDNVLDARYESVAGYQAPGVSVLGGVRAEF